METVDFLRLVLPSQGQYCIAYKTDSNKLAHVWGDLEHVALVGLRHQGDVWFGLGSYPRGREGKRQAAEVAALRAFWLDLDCGEGKGFPDMRAAATALEGFLEKTQLPRPLLVMSGGGLHVYWPLDVDVPAEAWKPVALALKAACHRHGFAADAGITADVARILRLPGTYNHKFNPPRLCKVLAIAHAGPVSIDVIRECVGEVAPPAPVAALPPELAALQIEHSPKSAVLIAAQCRQIGLMRDSKGCVPEPHWYAAITVLAHTVEADEIIHEWSAGHPSYSRGETDEKIAHARRSTGPRSCAEFRGLNPEGCANCPHRVKSPIILGEQGPAPAPEAAPPTETAPQGAEATEPAQEPGVPSSSSFGGSGPPQVLDPAGEVIPYRIQSGFFKAFFDAEGGLSGRFKVETTDGSEQWGVRQFTTTAVYPRYRYYDQEGEEHVVLSVYKHADGWRDADLPVAALSSTKLRDSLAKALIMAKTDDYPVVGAWLKEELNALAKASPAREVSPSFGWTIHGKGAGKVPAFVIGTTKMLPEGRQTDVTLPPIEVIGRTEKILQIGLQPHGSLDGWKDAVNVYGRHAQMRKERFLVSFILGTPLFNILGAHGAAVEAVGPTGLGKTATAYVGLAAYGKPSLLMVPGKSTVNGLFAQATLYQNLPMVIDEISDMTPQALSDLTYGVTQGEEKLRMRTGQMKSGGSWCTGWVLTTNPKTSDKLGATKVDVAAHLARVLEVDWSVGHHMLTDPQDIAAIKAVADAGDHYGHAGRVFVQYLIDNYSSVVDQVKAIAKNTALGINERSQDRFFSHTCTVAIAAAHFGHKLGLLPWDADDVRNYLFTELMPAQRGLTEEFEDAGIRGFVHVVNLLWADCLQAPRGLDARVTLNQFEQAVGGVVEPKSGRVRMRLDRQAQWIAIPRRVLREECTAAGLGASLVMAALAERQVLEDRKGRKIKEGYVPFNLGAGTRFSTAAEPCVCVNLAKLESSQEEPLFGDTLKEVA